VVVNLHNTGLSGKQDNCYMLATGGCDTKISGEHLISEGVLKILAEKQVELSGMHWLKGQKKVLGFAALTANCPCTRHNSLLSPIDVVGAKLFEAIQKCGTTDTGLGCCFCCRATMSSGGCCDRSRSSGFPATSRSTAP
jgi:hypothetical protein